MAAKVLTQRRLETIKASDKRREIPDGLLPGLYFICQPSGARSWAARFRRPDGRTAKLTLGAWPAVTLPRARELAREAIMTVKRGHDPIADRMAARDKAEASTANTVRNVCETYLAREGKKLRTLDQRRRLLERLVYPTLGGRQIDSVGRGEIVRLLDKIEDENGARTADMVLAVLRKIMNWHAVRHESYRTPIVRGMARTNGKELARSRILTDDELRAVWTAASSAEGAFRALVKFLLLTGARRGEAAGMMWSEIDGTDWLLPASRNKVKVDLCRPLSGAALAVLTALPRFAGCPYVFTSDGRRPVGSFSKFKKSFDKKCGVSDWTLHDLRRTARSLMSRAGVNADIGERCLGHIIPGVRGVYDRHQYRPEMLNAYEALATQIDLILHPRENVVTALRPKR
jgi:integrase